MNKRVYAFKVVGKSESYDQQKTVTVEAADARHAYRRMMGSFRCSVIILDAWIHESGERLTEADYL